MLFVLNIYIYIYIIRLQRFSYQIKSLINATTLKPTFHCTNIKPAINKQKKWFILRYREPAKLHFRTITCRGNFQGTEVMCFLCRNVFPLFTKLCENNKKRIPIYSRVAYMGNKYIVFTSGKLNIDTFTIYFLLCFVQSYCISIFFSFQR